MLRGAALGAVLVAAALAGCSEESPAVASPPSPTPTADDLAVARARAAASRLAASAQALATADPALAGVLGGVVADHRAHLTALGAPSTAPAPSASPSGGRGPAPDVRAQVSGETAAAQVALDDVRVVSPALAALLARIAAACAAHADLLAAKGGLQPPPALRTSATSTATPPSPAPLPGAAPTPGPSASPSATSTGSGAAASALPDGAREALAALTAGEHAAVYAYGAVVARVAGRQRDRAKDAWAWHMARRDLLEERLLAAGVQPPAAAPAYDLGQALTPSSAASLAATVEDRLAALGVRAVAATSGPDRSDAAEALVAGARRAAAWHGRVSALPG